LHDHLLAAGSREESVGLRAGVVKSRGDRMAMTLHRTCSCTWALATGAQVPSPTSAPAQ